MSWLKQMFTRHRRYDELSESIREHLDEKIADLMDRGMTRNQAESTARREFGNVARIEERSREVWQWPTIESIWADAKFGLRQLRKSPAFAITTIFIIALGIGAVISIFSVLDAALLKALPVQDPQQLVLVECPDVHGGFNGFPYSTFRYFRDHNAVFSGILASSIPEGLNVSVAGKATMIRGQVVSGDYYSVLGVSPAFGRAISQRDDKPGAPPVAVISYEFWKRQFDANKDVIGKTIDVNGARFTIIGVNPRGFFGLMIGWSPDVTVPIHAQSSFLVRGPAPTQEDTWEVDTIVGRLKPGVTTGQARANLNLLFQQTLTSQEQRSQLRIEVVPGRMGFSTLRDRFSQVLLLLMCAVGLLLLAASANVGNLLLSRSAARRDEMAMRLALGATRRRLIQQLLTEDLLLAMFGGVLGLGLSLFITKLVLALLASGSFPVVLDVHLDYRTLAFAALVTLATVLLFGLLPALHTTKSDATHSLKASARTTGQTRNSGSRAKALVISQVAISFLLLVGVGLLVHTLQTLKRLNPGFNPQNTLQFTVDPTLAGYSGIALQNLYDNLLTGMRSIPGVRMVSASRFAEFTPGRADVGISVPSRASSLEDNPTIQENLVGPDFFQAMGMTILSGRGFTLDDNGSASSVAVLNEAAAERFFGSVNPIGESIRLAGMKVPVQVVGVVKDAKYHSLREPAEAMVFVPFLQFPPDSVPRLTFEIRTAEAPGSVIPAVRQQAHRLDANLPLVDIKTLTEQIDESLMSERLLTTLSSLFASLALVLACVGLYGTLAYAVSQRTNEIGIRMALGAGRSNVLSLILWQGAKLALIGVVLGAGMAAALTRFMRALLFDVSPTDAVTFLGAGLLLTIVALTACMIPACRAASIDPMQALRSE